MHSDFPIERLALSTCKRWLASASHDQSIKIWDVAYLQEVEGDGEEEGAAAGEGALGASPCVVASQSIVACFWPDSRELLG